MTRKKGSTARPLDGRSHLFNTPSHEHLVNIPSQGLLVNILSQELRGALTLADHLSIFYKLGTRWEEGQVGEFKGLTMMAFLCEYSDQPKPVAGYLCLYQCLDIFTSFAAE